MSGCSAHNHLHPQIVAPAQLQASLRPVSRVADCHSMPSSDCHRLTRYRNASGLLIHTQCPPRCLCSPCQQHSQVAQQLGAPTLASELLLQEDLRRSSWMHDYPARHSLAALHGTDKVQSSAKHQTVSSLYTDKKMDTGATTHPHTLEWHALELRFQFVTAQKPLVIHCQLSSPRP